MAREVLVLSTNPNEENSVPLYRSDNQDGAEFTYSFWMSVDSMEYNGKWKHVFHRGNKTSFPIRAPGGLASPRNKYSSCLYEHIRRPTQLR